MERRKSNLINLYRDHWGEKFTGTCLLNHNSQRKQAVSWDLSQSVHYELRNTGSYKFGSIFFCA